MTTGRPSMVEAGDRAPAADSCASTSAMRWPTEDYSSGFVRWFARIFWPFARVWFRPRVEGLERIPRAPCMFVGNHSAYGVMEIFVFLCIWTRRFGTRRPAVGLSHDVGMTWPLRWGVARIGGVRASPEAAGKALSKGFDVLVFPGGDVDALRPFTARYEVHWKERAGFVRTAAEAGVPIVVLANCGSHAQYTLLPGGPTIARLIGLTRFRIYTWPLPLGSFVFLGAVLAWALGVLGPWWILGGFLGAFFPNPTRMQVKFLEPIEAKELLAKHHGDSKTAADAIRARLESSLRAMAAERKTAWG